MYVYIFFFKQKTAYEMRIIDWSSDVCSSDLSLPDIPTLMEEARAATGLADFGEDDWWREPLSIQLDSINREARLNKSGAITQRARLVGALAKIGRASCRERGCQ